MDQAGNSGVWGEFTPRGVGRLLLYAKNMGFVHGSAKKIMGRLWSALRLPTPVDIRYAGLKFRVQPWDNVVEHKMLFGSKLRDWSEITRLREFAGDGGVFLDIGANIGYYALMAAKMGAGKVLAFEPNPEAFSRLQFNISANDLGSRIRALQLALGDRNAMVTMSISNQDMGGSHIGDPDDSSGKGLTVQMKPLVDVLAEEGIDRIDAMKIDVEGIEDAVLFPFFETSPRHLWPRLLIIEHTSQQHWKRNLLAWMTESGYQEIERNRSNAMLRLR